MFFEAQEILTTSPMCLFLGCYAFGVMSKKLWPIPKLWRVIYMFSSKSFIVFALTFCSFIYFDFLNMACGSGPTLFLFFFFFCHTVCWFFVPKPGIKARAPAVRALSPNHRTSREVPQLYSSACGYPIVPAPFTEKILLPPLNGLGTLMLFNGYSTKHSIMWKYLTLFIWSLYIWTVQFSSVA